tara:strand:- start:1282 stop:1734 length:453 start_codon:yes stop_codon:yes gene_type:complete
MAIKLNNIKTIKIAPIDVNGKAAVGIHLPFNKKRVFTSDYTTRDHAKSKLTNVLLTSPGERLNQPLFGVGLKNKLFEQQIELSEKSSDLKSIITPQVQQYIPEIDIKNISLKDGGIAGHKLFVTVNYSLINNDEEDSVTLSFTNENFNDK